MFQFKKFPCLNKIAFDFFRNFKKCSSFPNLFTNLYNVHVFKFCSQIAKMFINSINLFGSLKNCSRSKICLEISKNVHIYSFCLKFQKLFRFQKKANLRNVCFFKFCSRLSSNVHVQKLFVFLNFVFEIWIFFSCSVFWVVWKMFLF